MPGPTNAYWQLVWNDEFSGDSIDPTHWTFDIGTGCPSLCGWGNNELEYYTSRTNNAYVAGGLLHIVAQSESYSGSSYTSAKLKTLGLFSQTYGRFEFRAKLPQGQGYWPALWMMPVNSVYGGWAASGEIDVMENIGSDLADVYGTIHYGGVSPNQEQSSGPSYTFPAGDSVTNFHVYALEWTSNAICWYMDNQLYETQTYWWSSGGTLSGALRSAILPHHEPGGGWQLPRQPQWQHGFPGRDASGLCARLCLGTDAATDHHSFGGQCCFDVADQCHRVHFAVHHEPWFIGGLEHQFSSPCRRQRAEHRDQSHLRHSAVFPVKPVMA